jgi:hypothetical protein
MCCCLVSGGEGWRSSDRSWRGCRTNSRYNLLFFSTLHLHSTTPLGHYNMPFFKTNREMPSPQSHPQAAPPSPPCQLPPPLRPPLPGITDVSLLPCDRHPPAALPSSPFHSPLTGISNVASRTCGRHPQAALPSPPCQLPPPFRPPLPGGTAVALRPCDRHHFILRLLSALSVGKDGPAKHDSIHGVWRVI